MARSFSLTVARVALIVSALLTAKAGKPMTLKTAASVSLLLLSLGSMLSMTKVHLTASSGRVCPRPAVVLCSLSRPVPHSHISDGS